ncbi:hypothetical protein AC578_4575 [Pseudocercospora eumusae]|uniref:Uncharacterized protein n=1 Tax=Pseudocercospora eumusae TaxID=321146 RepID=A0A139H464_9PEZI|nr:hypothetical protein AC578_4575 [Pseudocercospora eumusae]
MVISSVPVTSLAVHQSCGLCRKTGQKKHHVTRPAFSIRSSSDRGFTLGELADRLGAAKHDDRHRKCLNITYMCKTILTLDESDPIMIKRRQGAVTRMRNDLERKEIMRPENRLLGRGQ